MYLQGPRLPPKRSRVFWSFLLTKIYGHNSVMSSGMQTASPGRFDIPERKPRKRRNKSKRKAEEEEIYNASLIIYKMNVPPAPYIRCPHFSHLRWRLEIRGGILIQR